jgi:hypothetical protein
MEERPASRPPRDDWWLVISHLRAVAEGIDCVLFVRRTPARSHAEWLDDATLAALLEEEAKGLVS